MKKRILALTLAIVMVFSLLPVTAFAAEPTKYNEVGKGTEAEPWLIKNGTQLTDLAYAVRGEYPYSSPDNMLEKYFKLSDDFDNSSAPLTKIIGTYSSFSPSTSKSFSGHFDGNGRTVTLAIWSSGDVAMFSCLDNGGVIQNVITAGRVENSGDYSSYNYSVGLCAYLRNGTIINCQNKAAVSGATYAAGLCAMCLKDGQILNCYNTGTVSSKNVYAVCYYPADGAVIESCYYDNSTGLTDKFATGLSTAKMKQASGDDALVSRLNKYLETTSVTGCLKWAVDAAKNDGYPHHINHTHIFTYAVDADNAAKLTAKCTAGCTGSYNTTPLTLTLTKPEDADLIYNGDPKEVGFIKTDDLDEAEAWETETGTVPTVVYYLEDGTTLTYADDETNKGTAPKDPGTYVATVTAGEATAKLEFSIYCAQIDTDYYPSLEAALDVAEAGNTVTLLADITAEEDIKVEKNITLDLGGKILTLDGMTLTLNNADGVTVTKGTVDGATDKIIVNGKAEIKDNVTFAGTIQLDKDAVLTLPGTIELKAKADNTKLTYDQTTGKIKLLEGQFGFGKTTPVAVFVDVPSGGVISEMKVEITPKAASTVSVKVDNNGAASVCGAVASDTVVIGGVTYTAGTGDIPVVAPHNPFPSASAVTIPQKLAVEVNINNNTTAADGPTVATDANNNGSVTITLDSTTKALPAAVTIEKSGDTVMVDPDGSGTTVNSYETLADDTAVKVDAVGVATLIAGGVQIGIGENIVVENSDGSETKMVSVPSGGSTADVVVGQVGVYYDVTFPASVKVEIAGAEFTNEGSGNATIRVTFDDIEIVSGSVGVPKDQQVKVGKAKIENATGDKIVVTPKTGEDDTAEIEVDNNEFTYTGKSGGDETGVKLEKKGGEIVTTLNDEGATLVVKPVANDVNVKIVSGTETNAPYVLVDKSSAGSVEVVNGSGKLTANVTGNANNPTKVSMGGTQYTVPAKNNATFTTEAADALPTLKSGSVELDSSAVGSGEEIIVDDVTVTNTTGTTLTVTDNTEASGDDGKFDLTSGNDTFNYTAASNDADLTVTKNGSNLRFVLDATGETVTVPGGNTQTTEFSNNGTDVFVTVKGGSTGDVEVVYKGSDGFETEIKNDPSETSTATVGGTEYTVPKNTTTKLSVDTYNGVAKMTGASGAVSMPTTGKVKVDGVTVENTTGTTLTVTDNTEASGDDGKFDLTSGNDTFNYTAASNDTDLTVTKNANTGALQFKLDAAGETVEFAGGNTQTTEFSNNGTDVFVTVKGGSTGDVSVKNTATGFEAVIENDAAHKFNGTIKLDNEAILSLPGSIELKAKAASELTYDQTNDKIKLVSGELAIVKTTRTTVFVDVPSGAATAEMKVEITPASGSDVSVKADGSSASVIGAGTTDTVVIGGVSYAPVSDKDIPVVVPHKPFPSASSVTIPEKLAATVNVNSNTAADNGPTVTTDAANTGKVTIVPGSETVLPAAVTVEKSGNTVTIDPNGSGATAGTTYKTTADNTAFSVNATGNSTLTAGGVELDKGENVLIENADGTKTVTVAVPAATNLTAKVTAAATAGTYTVNIPVGGAVEIKGFKYTNEGSTVATMLVTVGTDGTPVIEITGGTVGVPTAQQVIVGSRKIENATGETIKVSTDGSVQIGSNQLTYTGKSGGDATGVKFTMDGSTVVATMNDVGAKLVVKPVASGDADVKITNGNAYALVKADSAGSVEVEKTATGLNATVTGDSSNPTKIEMGGTQYTVPAKNNATFTTTASNATAAITSGTVELDGTGAGEAIVVEGVTVTNTSEAVLTVTEDGTVDGQFDLQSGSDSFDYTAAAAAAGDDDLTVTKNGDNLQFKLDAAGETVAFLGTNTQTTEFSDGTNVFVTVNGDSKGDVKVVSKGNDGFVATIYNSKVENDTSTVTVGITTYTIPEKTTTKLIGTDDPMDIATLDYGTVELDKNEEVILKTTGLPYTVKNTDETESILLVTNEGDNGIAQLVLPKDGAVTVVKEQHQYSTLSGESAKLTATYVTDGTGDVTINGQKGVKLVLDSGAVQLTQDQTIHTNSITTAQITNPNSDTVDIEAAAGSDTVITLKKDQMIKVDKTEYTAKEDGGAKIAVDKESGKPKLIVGGIGMSDGNSIKVNDFTVEVPEGRPSITVGFGLPAEIELQASGAMKITDADGNEFTYVNNSKEAVRPLIDASGEMTLTLTDNASPDNLPAGSYESINIRATGEKQTTYTFEDDLDTVLARDNVNAGDVIVVNTNNSPSTSSYVLTQNGYTIYGVGGDLAKLGREGTDYEPNYLTVDSRERADYYGVSDMWEALAECMVVKVENGVVTVQAGEARIEWKNGTAYYVTLADALYDAANPADTSKNPYNTHNGKGASQTIIMNINPYADRENIMLENTDKLITCGEDPTKEGDSYTAQGDTVISMFENSNDVYVIDGTLIGNAGEDDIDDTVTIYMGPKDSDFYMSGEKNVTAHCCPVVMDIIKTALLEMKLVPTEGGKLIVKSEALDNIAAHIPHHSAYDATVGTPGTHGLLGFFASIFNAKDIGNQSSFTLLTGIFELITSFITILRNFFNK